MIGEVFNSLTVIAESSGPRRKALVRCSCGEEKLVRYDKLREGRVKSCGCKRNKVAVRPPVKFHGLSGTPTHRVWAHLVKCKAASDGHQWREFTGFLADMGVPPVPSRLAKLDGKAGYSKENCLWVPKTISKSEFLSLYPQVNRKVHGLPITCGDVSKSLSEWARFLGMTYMALYYRLYIGKDSRSTPSSVIESILKELHV